LSGIRPGPRDLASSASSITQAIPHMIVINETLGYRVIGPPDRSWELASAAAQS
jgi:hypothetical protein